jgi:hypothetical protein
MILAAVAVAQNPEDVELRGENPAFATTNNIYALWPQAPTQA